LETFGPWRGGLKTEPKRGLEIHWPGVLVLLVLAFVAWVFW